MRGNAANWLDLATKVWNFRRDHLNAKESAELVARTQDLRRLLREKADAGKLKLGIESLESVLSRTGGAIYPKTSLVENVEFFLVAAIVILGVRSYFFQPFKIPTNSMWPSYYGMTADNIPPDKPAPGPLQSAFRFLAFGAIRHSITSPHDGEIIVPLITYADGNRHLLAVPRKGHTWLIFPAQVKEYTFYVNGDPASVEVPADFSGFDDVFFNTYFPNREALEEQIERTRQDGTLKVSYLESSGYQVLWLPTGKMARAGQPIVRFDILTGDQLFVDRVTYNFVRPSVGQGFVFRTDNIPDIVREYGAQYYIKRLIGVPGDQIEIREPAIYRNGAPITGSKAFELNANRAGLYRGYFNATHQESRFRMLFKGETITVPPNSYLALGDNSRDSFDGRFWGFVPARDVVGRPLFIYYPLTRRWGTAR
ncbi:MAG TPA: signal peptidase I [Opitutaceae bacterium]